MSKQGLTCLYPISARPFTSLVRCILVRLTARLPHPLSIPRRQTILDTFPLAPPIAPYSLTKAVSARGRQLRNLQACAMWLSVTMLSVVGAALLLAVPLRTHLLALRLALLSPGLAWGLVTLVGGDNPYSCLFPMLRAVREVLRPDPHHIVTQELLVRLQAHSRPALVIADLPAVVVVITVFSEAHFELVQEDTGAAFVLFALVARLCMAPSAFADFGNIVKAKLKQQQQQPQAVGGQPAHHEDDTALLGPSPAGANPYLSFGIDVDRIARREPAMIEEEKEREQHMGGDEQEDEKEPLGAGYQRDKSAIPGGPCIPGAGLSPEPSFDCPFCCVTYPESRGVCLAQCEHRMCASCARRTLDDILARGKFPAECPCCVVKQQEKKASSAPPEAGGASGISPREVTHEALVRLLDLQEVSYEWANRFRRAQGQFSIAQPVLALCLRCQLPSRVARAEVTYVACPFCTLRFCRKCDVRWHSGITCEEHQRYMSDDAPNQANDQLSEALIARLAKPCPLCEAPTIHWRGHACHHIRPGTGCPNCGTHWCFACGGQYNGNVKACGCDLFCDRQGRCGCPVCPDCTPAAPCDQCSNDNTCLACHPL